MVTFPIASKKRRELLTTSTKNCLPLCWVNPTCWVDRTGSKLSTCPPFFFLRKRPNFEVPAQLNVIVALTIFPSSPQTFAQTWNKHWKATRVLGYRFKPWSNGPCSRVRMYIHKDVNASTDSSTRISMVPQKYATDIHNWARIIRQIYLWLRGYPSGNPCGRGMGGFRGSIRKSPKFTFWPYFFPKKAFSSKDGFCPKKSKCGCLRLSATSGRLPSKHFDKLCKVASENSAATKHGGWCERHYINLNVSSGLLLLR